MKISPDGSTIVYSTFLQAGYPNPNFPPSGGQVLAVIGTAVDPSGALYLLLDSECFVTINADRVPLMPIPVSAGAAQTVPPVSNCNTTYSSSSSYIVVAKLNSGGSALGYATYLGGPTSQIGNSISSIPAATRM